MLKITSHCTKKQEIALADRARRDGRMMAAELKMAGPRSNLHEFHLRISEMATRYSESGFPEFESEYYRNIR